MVLTFGGLGYNLPKTKSAPLSSLETAAAPDNFDVNEKRAYSFTLQQNPPDFYGTSHMALQPRAMVSHTVLPHNSQSQAWNFGGDSVATYPPPFQDIFFSSLDSFNVGGDFTNSDAFLGPQAYPNSNGLVNHATSGNESLGSIPQSTADGERQKVLIEHFVTSTNPVSVILPTHTEWTSACRSLLAMANESVFLISSICAISALHLHTTRGDDCLDEAFRNYKFSSRTVNEILDHPRVEDRQLKQAFATIFLLTHVEVGRKSSSTLTPC
jgi:hypothetical protein